MLVASDNRYRIYTPVLVRLVDTQHKDCLSFQQNIRTLPDDCGLCR